MVQTRASSESMLTLAASHLFLDQTLSVTTQTGAASMIAQIAPQV
jgi:hypothetical protein